MGIILSKFTVCGVKNIEKPIEIDFMNYADDRKDGPDYHNVFSYKNTTAIYGPNGSGKSAIIHGFEILIGILLDRNYLLMNERQEYLNAIMNRKTNSMMLAVEFFVSEQQIEKPRKYRYLISLQKNNPFTKDIDILKEEFIQLKPDVSVIVSVENGDIKEGVLGPKTKEVLRNRLINRSFFETVFFDVQQKNLVSKEEDLLIDEIQKPIGELITNLHCRLEFADAHAKFLINKEKHIQIVEKFFSDKKIDLDNLHAGILPKEMFSQFEKDVKDAADFLRIFKPDLKKIEIIKKEDRNIYYTYLNFVYTDYRIDVDLESVGIKKLFELFLFFKNLSKPGKVLVIDELDSAINDAYLSKMIEYFADYSKGQIIFTTHNTSPMDVMNCQNRRNKCQICFLDTENNLTIWKHKGSYSPSNIYKKGLIKGLPFSLEAFDFIDIFRGHDK
ncbi:MAG: ATP-binding protein [Christensenellaceae bacterium]|jgi:AAA15 family ATPase/GTPase|nr:ATP-binding protein [Christensenellaceae bacterium]